MNPQQPTPQHQAQQQQGPQHTVTRSFGNNSTRPPRGGRGGGGSNRQVYYADRTQQNYGQKPSYAGYPAGNHNRYHSNPMRNFNASMAAGQAQLAFPNTQLTSNVPMNNLLTGQFPTANSPVFEETGQPLLPAPNFEAQMIHNRGQSQWSPAIPTSSGLSVPIEQTQLEMNGVPGDGNVGYSSQQQMQHYPLITQPTYYPFNPFTSGQAAQPGNPYYFHPSQFYNTSAANYSIVPAQPPFLTPNPYGGNAGYPVGPVNPPSQYICCKCQQVQQVPQQVEISDMATMTDKSATVAEPAVE